MTYTQAYSEAAKTVFSHLNESTVNARKATSSIDLEVAVCAYVCVNCEISVKCFQRLLNYVINKKNNLSFDVSVKMRQVV